MRHFDYVKDEDSVFYKLPEEINNKSDKNLIAVGLGALLYMPATKVGWEKDLLNNKHEGLTSMVLDLEDALQEKDLHNGIKNIVDGFNVLKENEKDLPFIFIRVKNTSDLSIIIEGLGKEVEKNLTGVILPKFDSFNASLYLSDIEEVNKKYGTNLLIMPIIESSRVMNKETRMEELMIIREMLSNIKDNVLNVRVGATDFTSNFGIRRTVNNTVYDMRVVSDCLVDIVNIFCRETEGYVVSGPVWEFFDNKSRILKPVLRENLFSDYGKIGKEKRRELLGEYNDGLIKEVLLDKINGFTGKTIIHPTHIKIVNSLNAVSYEEYKDALVVIDSERNEGGVLRSESGNKMNEVKPHYYWAEKMINRARAFGVLNKGKTFVDLLDIN